MKHIGSESEQVTQVEVFASIIAAVQGTAETVHCLRNKGLPIAPCASKKMRYVGGRSLRSLTNRSMNNGELIGLK